MRKLAAAESTGGRIEMQADPAQVKFKLLQLVHHPRYLSSLESAFGFPSETGDLLPFRSDMDTYVTGLVSKRAILCGAGAVVQAVDQARLPLSG